MSQCKKCKYRTERNKNNPYAINYSVCEITGEIKCYEGEYYIEKCDIKKFEEE